MIKITVKEEVEQALTAAFPFPRNSAPRALDKYVRKLEQLLNEALLYGQTPAQRKLDTFSISLHRLANEGGQIGSKRVRVHAWLRDNNLALVRTAIQGSNITGKLSDLKFSDLVELTEEVTDVEQEKEDLLDENFEDSGALGQAIDVGLASDSYHVLEVDLQSLRGYIQWLQTKATLMKKDERARALAQAQTVLAEATGTGGRYLQRKKPSEFGRMYYEGVSIQNVNKELRRAILGNAWEYDIHASVISWKMGFAQSLLEAHGIGDSVRLAFPATLNYLEDRADFMRTVRHFIFLEGSRVPTNLQTKLLKQAVTAISFGARATSTGWYDMAGEWTNPALVQIIKNSEERQRFLGDTTIRKFIQEQNALDDFICAYFKREAPEYLARPCLQTPSGRVSKSKVLAFFYQHTESHVMEILRLVASEHGHLPLANIHDAVFFRKRLGVGLKNEIELVMQEQTGNPYWKLTASELQPYRFEDKVLKREADRHMAWITSEEERAQKAPWCMADL